MPPKPLIARPVRYHLRAPLTLDRLRGEEHALWRIIRAGKVDEVMVFVPHAEERSPGLGTHAENRAMVQALRPLFRRLRRAGVAPSLNIWWTVAFSDFPALPRQLHSRFRFRWAVNAEGHVSRAAACPLDPAWRAHIRRMYRTFAALKPVRLWIDDDVRMTLRADMQSPCFCRACLAEMARRTGRTLRRPDLIRAILADPPNPVREAWLDFQRQLERDVVRGLTRAVHGVSPRTRVSLMFSPPEHHWAEGRRWGELVEALGRPAPTLRPSIGPYTDATAVPIASSLNTARLSAAALPGVALAPEIENYPHSRFAKSARLAAADMVLGQLIGMREATFSIYRFGGRLDLETRRERIWERLLGGLKPRLQAIADLGIRPDQARGVSLYFHENVCRHSRGVADQPKPIFLYRERPWDHALPLLGIATRYGTGPVTAFAGEAIACLSPEERRAVFSRGVLLDARAADCLLRLGQGGLAGLVRRLPDAGASQELIEDPAFGGLAGDPMNVRWDGAGWQFAWAPGARILSSLRDYDGRRTGHGVVVFENALGGRVAVYPYDGQARGAFNLGFPVQPIQSPSFLCWSRQAQLKAVLEWLGDKPVPLFVPGAPSIYPLLSVQDRRWVVGVANLSPDPAASLQFHLQPPTFRIRRIRYLNQAGTWRACPHAIHPLGNGALKIRTRLTLAYLDVAVLALD